MAAMSPHDAPDAAASELAAGLVALLDLHPVAPDVFEGTSSPQPGGHVFGGQVMGQAVVALGRTVPSERRIHSCYSYFLSPGDPDVPIRFTVDRLRDGGSFSVRRVLAQQEDAAGGPRTILAMTGSFQEEQEGLEHADPAPEAPDPEGLPTTAEALDGIDHPIARYWATQRPIDIRHVTEPVYVHPDRTEASTQMVWMRLPAPVEVPALLDDALLAFASDYTPFEAILRRQGLTWSTPGLRAATIDHAIWWHRHPSLNEWLLYVQQSPSASGGRGLTDGRIFDRDGGLVATVTQEGMIRVRR